MKASRLVVGSVVLALLSAACGGDQGPVGPTGANVSMFEFGSRTITGADNYTIQVSRGVVDSGLVLLYYNPAPEAESAWYPIPGAGSGGLYETRFFMYQSATDPSTYTIGVRLIKPDGSGAYATPVTFRKLKVLIVPASSVTSLNLGGPAVDLGDYEAVAEYLDVRR